MLRGNVITCLLSGPMPVIEWRISTESAIQLKGLRLLITNVNVLGSDLRTSVDDATDAHRHEGWSLSLSFSETRLAEEWVKGIMLHGITLLNGNHQSKIQPAQPAGPRCEFCGHAATMASQLDFTSHQPALTFCTACRWLWHKYPQNLHERMSMADELIDLAKNHCWDNLKVALKQMPSFINYKPPYRNYYILHHIAYFGALDMVRWLKSYLPNVDWTVTTNDRKTASRIARLQHKHTAALLLKLAEESENASTHAVTVATVDDSSAQDVRALFQRIGPANGEETDTGRAEPMACSVCFATTNRDKSNSCMLCYSTTCASHMVPVKALNLEYHNWMTDTSQPSAWHICVRCYNKNWWLNRPPGGLDISVVRVCNGVLPDWYQVQLVWQRWGRAKWMMAIPKFTVLSLLHRMEIERVSKFKQMIRHHYRPTGEYADPSPLTSPTAEAVSTTRQSLVAATQLSFRRQSRSPRNLNANVDSVPGSPRGVKHMLSKITVNERLVEDVVKLCLSSECVDLCRRFIPVPPVWDTKEEVFQASPLVKSPGDEVKFVNLLVEFLSSEQVWICQLHCVLYRLDQNVHHENSTGEHRTLWFLAAMKNAVRDILKEHRRMQRWLRAELNQMRIRRTKKSPSAVISRGMVMQVRT